MNKKVVGAVCIVSTLFALNGGALTFAVDSVDFSLTVGQTLSLTIPTQPQSISITPTAAGYYDSTNFNVSSATNNITGYTLKMGVANTDLVSDTINVITGEPPVIPTLTASQEGISAEAFAASTDTNVLNHYGVSIAGGNFNAMPDRPVDIKITDTNNSSSADTTTIAIASKLDLNTVPGTYSTTINFTIVVNPMPSQSILDDDPDITKNSNHSDCFRIGDKTCEDTDNDGVSDSVVFEANSLLRAYEIAYTKAGKPMYIETTDTANYPTGWKPMEASDYATVGGKQVRFAIQDLAMTYEENNTTHNVCEWADPSTYTNSYMDTALVMDLRDGTSYNIVKAADSRCWMQDNLALDLTNATVLANLSTTNTNVNNASLIALRSGNRTAGDNYATAGVANWTSSFSHSVPLVHALSKNTSRTDLTNPADLLTEANGWEYGVYYNFCAASAGSHCYGNGTTGAAAVDKPGEIDAEYDVCPSGWRMPTSSEYIDVYSPYTQLPGEDIYLAFRNALHVPLSGEYYDNSTYNHGSYGYFWTSTLCDGYLNTLEVDTEDVMPYQYEEDRFGYSVRCVNKTGNE